MCFLGLVFWSLFLNSLLCVCLHKFPQPLPAPAPHQVILKILLRLGAAKPTTLVSSLANSTLIILFSEFLKILKNISSKSKNIVKDNNEYGGRKWNLVWK